MEMRMLARVALQASLLQRLLAAEAMHHQYSSCPAGDISFNAMLACEKGVQCNVAGDISFNAAFACEKGVQCSVAESTSND
eukprot:1863436-Karenia_brevis.AAC.1